MSIPYRTAVVTGASSGIGRSFARVLAQRGVNLVIAARRIDRLDQLAQDLATAHRVRVEPIRCDLSDEQDLSKLEDRVRDPADPVDLLVNNAGFGTTGLFHTLPADRELDQLMVNVAAPLRLTRAAVPGMVGRGLGGVICVSSMVGALPMPGSATYGATKAFLTAFHESLHVELRGRGVTVTTVNAGLTRTEFHEAAGTGVDGIPAMAWLDADRVAVAGLRGLLAGRPIVAPGALNKAQIPMFRLIPRSVLRSMVRRMWKV